ncbi:carbohydrate ABC transporter permease [Cellulomonas humilata]|uniref:carbohydrate ABC transporter permease n=1 Tax=Cellulomonas humilata TaxID=144055 RepID=UPI0027D86FC9|nr:sugar ABC transporter permease [Cellulomonas humilata]
MGWAFVAPFVIVFVMFLIWPLVHGFYLSFTGESITGAGGELIGFDNYAEALRDPIMWRSLLNTLWFTVLSTVPLVVVALILALLVHQGLPGQWLWRLSFFMPFLLASTVAAQFWIWMYNPQLGLVNYVLGAVGVEQIAWLQDPQWAMLAVVIMTLWWTVGFNFLLYLTALQNIPEQQYEASALDGAGRWRQLRSITVPQLGPTTVLIVILQVLASLKVFDQIYIMTQGGPGGVTRPVVQYVFEVGFTGYRFGYASSIAYIFFAIIVIISVGQMRLTTRRSA